METACQSISFTHSLDSEPSLSRSSSYSVLEGSTNAIPLHVQSSFLSSDAGSSSSALNALYEGGSRGVFQWIEATAQVSQAVKVCLEQLVGPNTPGHVKRGAADVLAYVCLGRHQQCSLALMSSDINDLICQTLKIASCSDARIVRRSTQLCVLLLLCSLHQEQESREAVFGHAERAAVVLHLCLRLVASRHLSTAGEAAACLLAPLLPLLASQTQAEAATRAVVDLLKHCVEVGDEGEGLGAWLLSEHSSSAAEEGHAAEKDVHTLVHPLALRPPLFSDGTSGSVVSGSSRGESSGASISDAVAVVACKVLHVLLHTEAHSSSAAGVVVEERGLAPLVALLEGRGAVTTAVQAPAVSAPEAAATAAAATAAPASTSVQSARSTADAILGGGTISCTATELGVWATDCLFDVMEVCAARGAAAQVVAASGVKALLQLLQLLHADSPLSHKALHMLCQLLGATEGQQALMNLGGLPVLAGFAQTQPELVLGTLAALCSSSVVAMRAAVAQCQPALCALVHAIGYPSATVSQQAIAALQLMLDAAAPHTASDPELAAGAGAGCDRVAAPVVSQTAPIERAMAGEEQHQGFTFEEDGERAAPDQAATATAATAAACPVALRLAEAGAMQQLDSLLGALVDGGDSGTAEGHDHLRAAFSLSAKLAVASPDACHALLHLQQQLLQQQQQQKQELLALCGTFRACAVLLRTQANPSDKLVASALLLRLLQHCRTSCAAPSTCEAQQQQQQQQKGQGQELPAQREFEGEGAGVLSWVGWAAGHLAGTLPTGDSSYPLAQTEQQQRLQQQQQQQQELTALLGVTEALEMIPLGFADTVFTEDVCCLRQLTHMSTLLTPPASSRPLFSAACAGVPHSLLSHAFALVQHHCRAEHRANSRSTSRRAWGCALLQLTAPGLAAALTAETPHPLRHTLCLGLQAVECAMALCSSSSSSDGHDEHSNSNGGSNTATPHSAAVIVCNGLLACVGSAAVQGQVEQQQTQAVLCVCAYVQQQLLARPEPWHVLLGIDAHAASELNSVTQQRLRAVIVALSQEQQCAHFQAVAAAALTVADFNAKQAQAVPVEPQAKRKAADKGNAKQQKQQKSAEKAAERASAQRARQAGVWPSMVRPGLESVAQMAGQVGLAVHKEAAKRLKGAKAVQRKGVHKAEKQDKKSRPAAGEDSKRDPQKKECLNKLEGEVDNTGKDACERAAAGVDAGEQAGVVNATLEMFGVEAQRADCMDEGAEVDTVAEGKAAGQPLSPEQQQQQQQQKDGVLPAGQDNAEQGTASGGEKEGCQVATKLVMATDEGLTALGGELVAACSPVKQGQTEMGAARSSMTQGQTEDGAAEGILDQGKTGAQESTEVECSQGELQGEKVKEEQEGGGKGAQEGGPQRGLQGGIGAGEGVEETLMSCSSYPEVPEKTYIEGLEQGDLLGCAPCAGSMTEGEGLVCPGEGGSGAEQGKKKNKEGDTGEAKKKGKGKEKGGKRKEEGKGKKAKAEQAADAKNQAARAADEAASETLHAFELLEAPAQHDQEQQAERMSESMREGERRLAARGEHDQGQQDEHKSAYMPGDVRSPLQHDQGKQQQPLLQAKLAQGQGKVEPEEQHQQQQQVQEQEQQQEHPVQEAQGADGSGKAKKGKGGKQKQQQQLEQRKKRAEGAGKAKKGHKQQARRDAAKAQALTAPSSATPRQAEENGSAQGTEQEQRQQQQQSRQQKRKQQQWQWDKLPVWGKVMLGVANVASGSTPKVAQAWRYCRESFL